MATYGSGDQGAGMSFAPPAAGSKEGFDIEPSATEYQWNLKERSREAGKKKLITSSLFVFAFMIAEIVGGIIANSLAIMTDAAHLMSDVSSFGISIAAIHFARKRKTRKLSFGSGRLEILGAAASIIIIWCLMAWLLYEAIDRTIMIINDEPLHVDGKLMTIIASLGILVNLIMIFILQGGHSHEHGEGGDHGHSHDMIGLMKQAFGKKKGGHSHSHGGGDGGHGDSKSDHGHSHGGKGGHSHSHDKASDDEDEGGGFSGAFSTIASVANLGASQIQQTGINASLMKAKSCTRHERCDGSHGEEEEEEATEGPASEEEINVRAALIHVWGDLLQSVGVLVAAIIIWVHPKWKIADPICTFLFSILVLFTTIPVMTSAIQILLEKMPPKLTYDQLKREVEKIEGVVSVHDLHCWQISQGVSMLVVHVLASDKILTGSAQDCFDLVDKVRDMLYKKFKLYHCSVEIDNAYLKKRQECFFDLGLPDAKDGIGSSH